MAGIAIIDAHQHFWDLQRGRYPWLQGEAPAAFRYGDTRILRQSYLPEQYARDTRGWAVRASVHVDSRPCGPNAQLPPAPAVTVASGPSSRSPVR